MPTYGGVDWMPDGRALVFSEIVSGRMQLFTISSEGGEPQRLTDEHANCFTPGFAEWTMDCGDTHQAHAGTPTDAVGGKSR